MFGYTRRGAEIRPSVCDGVAPMNPTPSTSRQGGTTNGRLQIGDRDGFDTRTDGTAKKDERGTLDVTFWHHRWFDSEKEGDPSENIVGPTRGEGEGGPDLRSTGSG